MICVVRKPALNSAYAKTKAQISCAVTVTINSTIPLLPKSEMASSVAVQPGLYPAWLETLKTVFLIMQLKSCQSSFIWVT